MKTIIIKIASIVVSVLTAAPLAFCQGFVNLDFESARIIPLTSGGNFPPYSVATTNALPGWTVYYGASQQSQVTYNDPALGSTFVTLWATNGVQLAGKNSVLLQGGITDSAATIAQTGLVPASAQSLLFFGAGNSSSAPVLLISLGGQNLPFFAISNGPNYKVYGASISSFAGQTAALTFSALEDLSGYNDWNIDNIQFSSSPIPEPSALALSALGGLLSGLRFWKRSPL